MELEINTIIVCLLGGNVLGIGMVFLLQALISMPPFGPPPFTPSNVALLGKLYQIANSTRNSSLCCVFLSAILLFAVFVLAFYNGKYKRMHLERKAPHVHGILSVDFTVGGDDEELAAQDDR